MSRHCRARRHGGRRGRAVGAGALAAIALSLLAAASASAAGVSVTLDDAKPALEQDGNAFKVGLGLTNLTDQAVTLSVDSVRPAPAKGCTVQFDKTATVELAPAAHAAPHVTYSAGCDVPKQGVAFTVKTSGGPAQQFDIEAAPKPDPAPDWDTLWSFAAALGASLIVLWLLLLVHWDQGPGAALTYLPTTWSFSDSWVSNITVLGGVFTGIVGTSDVVKAWTGAEAGQSIALATVGAGVAAGFIGLGAIVLQSTRTGDAFTAGGLITAAAVTLAGAYGELYVVWQSGERLELGGWEHRLKYAVVAVMVLLAIYAVRTMRATLDTGTTKPKPTHLKISPDGVAAAVIAAAVGDSLNADQLIAEINRRLRRHHALPATVVQAISSEMAQGADADAIVETIDAHLAAAPIVAAGPGGADEEDAPRPVRPALL
jgi:hypothetical protein